MVVTNSPSGGGAERTMNNLVNLLHANEIEVSIFPINHGDLDWIEPICEVVTPVRNWKAGLIPTIYSFFAFRSRVTKINPTLVIANCELPELYSVFLPLRIKLVFVEHTSSPWRNHRFLGFLIRSLARLRGTDWVLVSDHLESRFLYKKPISVIPNLISGKEYQLAKEDSPVPRAVFLGRLSDEKDPELFLDVVRLSGCPATIIGSGILAQELATRSESEKLPVEFLGQLNNPWGAIHPNDIIIITSRFEGDGLVLLEAISRNLSVLVRDIPDLRRFGLPELNYFKTADAASAKLIELKKSSSTLRIPLSIATRILSSRNEKIILSGWVGLIKRFTIP